MAVEGFREFIFNFLWYCVEMVYMLSVIAYVSFTVDFPRGYWNRRGNLAAEVPAAAMGNTWGNAASFLQDATVVARTLKQTLNGEVAAATVVPTPGAK